MKQWRCYILVLSLCSLLLTIPSCRPKGILHSWEMRKLLVDLHKTDALLQMAGLQFGHEEEKRIYYVQVLEQHGVTQAQFDSSLVWYTAHPQLFDKIYPKVLADLKEEETQFIALHEGELNLLPEQISLPEQELKPTDIPFTTKQLDSVLWVTLHGYTNPWHERPLVQDFENQFFPQIGILSGGVIDTLESRVSLTQITDN